MSIASDVFAADICFGKFVKHVTSLEVLTFGQSSHLSSLGVLDLALGRSRYRCLHERTLIESTQRIDLNKACSQHANQPTRRPHLSINV